jgi:protein-L-isoaspartate(D-aspartate) O-methyltransferase
MCTESLELARHNMVQQQIRPWNVFDARVLDLLTEIPRDRFVPEEYQELAYADTEIPIADNRCMMVPRMEAKLLQALDIQPTDKILEVGTGCGFVTACLARLGGEVVSIEADSELSAQAEKELEALGINNVLLLNRDPAANEGPYDAIAVNGSLPAVGETLKRQLKVGGRLFAVTGEDPSMSAVLITRVGEDAWRSEMLFETELAPLPPQIGEAVSLLS